MPAVMETSRVKLGLRLVKTHFRAGRQPASLIKAWAASDTSSEISTQWPAPRLLPPRLAAYVDLLHLAPIAFVLLAAIGFLVAAKHVWPPMSTLAPFLVSVLLTQLAVSLHNDYCDRQLDSAAKPWRALPSGLLSPSSVLGAALAFTALGLLSALSMGWTVTVLVAAGTAAGFLYNAWLKRTLWTWVPFWVALPTLALCAFTAMGRTTPRLWLAYVIGAPLVLGVYLADTLTDIESDASLGVHGLAQRLGTQVARAMCWGGVALALCLAGALSADADFRYAFAAPGALLALAMWSEWSGRRRLHWALIMASAIALSVVWLFTL